MRPESTFLFAVSLVARIFCLEAFYYWQYDLKDYCDYTITLPCRRDLMGRAGTMKFAAYVQPNSSCVVNITVDSRPCGFGSSNYDSRQAIYFNVIKQQLYSTSQITLRQQSTSDPTYWFEEKIFSGDGYVSKNPTSIAQYLSRPYWSNTQISLVFEGANSDSGFMNFELDYNVLHLYSDKGDSYCNALSGYILNEVICETGQDRLNCPFSYYLGTPAYGKDQGSQSACYKSYTSSYDYYSYSSTDSGSTAGIAVGVTIGVIILLTLLLVVSRRNAMARRHVAGVTVPVNNQHSYQNPGRNREVTSPDGPAPYAVQQHPGDVFAAPPPSYDKLYPDSPAAPAPADPDVQL